MSFYIIVRALAGVRSSCTQGCLILEGNHISDIYRWLSSRLKQWSYKSVALSQRYGHVLSVVGVIESVNVTRATANVHCRLASTYSESHRCTAWDLNQISCDTQMRHQCHTYRRDANVVQTDATQI